MLAAFRLVMWRPVSAFPRLTYTDRFQLLRIETGFRHASEHRSGYRFTASASSRSVSSGAELIDEGPLPVYGTVGQKQIRGQNVVLQPYCRTNCPVGWQLLRLVFQPMVAPTGTEKIHAVTQSTIQEVGKHFQVSLRLLVRRQMATLFKSTELGIRYGFGHTPRRKWCDIHVIAPSQNQG